MKNALFGLYVNFYLVGNVAGKAGVVAAVRKTASLSVRAIAIIVAELKALAATSTGRSLDGLALGVLVLQAKQRNDEKLDFPFHKKKKTRHRGTNSKSK